MSSRDLPNNFQVAFSYAGEQRDLVRRIAEAVEKELGAGTVFFDDWFEYYVAGNDADRRLQEIYRKKSEMVVVCVSESYRDKPWTLVEHEAIRARLMETRSSKEGRGQLRILPIRVGEGEIQDIFFSNTIIPDVRTKPLEQSVELIVKRLHLILSVPASEVSTYPAWPKEPVYFDHGLADRAAEWPAVSHLFTSDSQKRILIFKGPSNYSKSSLLNAADLYAKALHVPTAYVDFKDTKLLTEANVLLELKSRVGSVLPEFEAQPNRWRLQKALGKLQQPVLILLDTYERATETSKLVAWLESSLLTEVNNCKLLRFIIAGQKVPTSGGTRWNDRADTVELERIYDKSVWKAWVHQINSNVDEKHVEGIVLGMAGVPGDINNALRTLCEHLN
jgi:hypothetical protein